MTSKGAESVAGVGLQGSSIGRAAIAAQPVALALAYMSRRRWNHTGITIGVRATCPNPSRALALTLALALALTLVRRRLCSE